MKPIKPTLAIGVVFFLATSSYATIRTVSNSPSTTLAQFNDIQAAVNASASGDTVYVHGSPISYAGFSITNKQLVIIGPGWSPDKALPHLATVAGITITGVASSNTEIQGLNISLSVSIPAVLPSNLKFIRNRFNAAILINNNGWTHTGFLFEGNLFSNAGVSGHEFAVYQNFVFKNNIFYNTDNNTFNNIINPLNTIIFDHNLWYGPSSGVKNCFNNCGSLIISNNIFVRRDAAATNSASFFSNNITFNAGNNSPWNSNGNQDNGGNVSNQDPQMVAQTSVNSGVNNPILDFTIAAGPADNAGTDGKDMGLLYDSTGSLNWTNSRNSRLPRIFTMAITNPTLESGGTLNVNVEARKSN